MFLEGSWPFYYTLLLICTPSRVYFQPYWKAKLFIFNCTYIIIHKHLCHQISSIKLEVHSLRTDGVCSNVFLCGKYFQPIDQIASKKSIDKILWSIKNTRNKKYIHARGPPSDDCQYWSELKVCRRHHPCLIGVGQTLLP